MGDRKYTLELTAEELLAYDAQIGATAGMAAQMRDAIAKAKADREADDLRLPWAYAACPEGPCVYWNWSRAVFTNQRQAKLASAAPELLEAVRAAAKWADDTDYDFDSEWQRDVEPAITRALRKVSTGVPEEK